MINFFEKSLVYTILLKETPILGRISNKKIPDDMALVGLEPQDVIQYITFKRPQKLEEQIDVLRTEVTEKVDSLRTDMKRLEDVLKEHLRK